MSNDPEAIFQNTAIWASKGNMSHPFLTEDNISSYISELISHFEKVEHPFQLHLKLLTRAKLTTNWWDHSND